MLKKLKPRQSNEWRIYRTSWTNKQKNTTSYWVGLLHENSEAWENEKLQLGKLQILPQVQYMENVSCNSRDQRQRKCAAYRMSSPGVWKHKLHISEIQFLQGECEAVDKEWKRTTFFYQNQIFHCGKITYESWMVALSTRERPNKLRKMTTADKEQLKWSSKFQTSLCSSPLVPAVPPAATKVFKFQGLLASQGCQETGGLSSEGSEMLSHKQAWFSFHNSKPLNIHNHSKTVTVFSLFK